jgi:hypothetical protein
VAPHIAMYGECHVDVPHVKVVVSSASNVKTSPIVPFKKLTTRNSFFQSPSFASLTREDKKEIAGSISGRALLHINIAFITNV